MRIVWVCHYPVDHLSPQLKLFRNKYYHPAPWIVNLVHEFSKNEHLEVHVITESAHILRKKIIIHNNITFHVLKKGIPFIPFSYPSFMNLDFLFKFFFNRKRIQSEINTIRPDIIHAHGTETQYAISTINSSFPYVVSIQGLIHSPLNSSINCKSRFLRKFEKEVVNSSRYIIAQSSYVANKIKELDSNTILFKSDLLINQEFIELKRSSDLKNYVVYIGSEEKHKRLDNALIAFGEFIKQYSDYNLIVIGIDASNKNKYSSYLLNISNKVLWKGKINSHNIKEILSVSRMLIVPSIFETYSMVVAEGLAAGVPVIASNVGGIPSLIEHNVNGFLVEKDNTHALIQYMLKVAGDLTLQLRISETSRKLALQRFNRTAIANTHITIYNKIIKQAQLCKKTLN